MGTHHYTFVQTPRMYIVLRVNHNVNYGIWVIILCQRRLIICNKSITIRGSFDNGETMHVWVQRVYGKSLHFFPQFCCDLELL